MDMPRSRGAVSRVPKTWNEKWAVVHTREINRACQSLAGDDAAANERFDGSAEGRGGHLLSGNREGASAPEVSNKKDAARFQRTL
jgi:hypothetical protein